MFSMSSLSLGPAGLDFDRVRKWIYCALELPDLKPPSLPKLYYGVGGNTKFEYIDKESWRHMKHLYHDAAEFREDGGWGVVDIILDEEDLNKIRQARRAEKAKIKSQSSSKPGDSHEVHSAVDGFSVDLYKTQEQELVARLTSCELEGCSHELCAVNGRSGQHMRVTSEQCKSLVWALLAGIDGVDLATPPRSIYFREFFKAFDNMDV